MIFEDGELSGLLGDEYLCRDERMGKEVSLLGGGGWRIDNFCAPRNLWELDSRTE